jgi:fructose-1,6-bisphosphatase/inositol monophosphatase family enzyme
VLTTDERFPRSTEQREGWRRLAESAAISRTWGDCYGYLLVATGRAEVMVDGIVSPWDSAALFPLITEAGGTFSDWTGAPTAFGDNVIATNAAAGVRARELLGAGAVEVR